MTFAFLFLTYDNFTHPDAIWEFTKTQNIYIHPKYSERVIPKYRPYIIESSIETKWGESSIIDATIKLLADSYQSEENVWFVLLSQDSYPLYSFETFATKINRMTQGDASIFNLINEKNGLSKTSQWWILQRKDVKTILENDSAYRKVFKMGKKSDGAFDEFYLLSLLRWVDSSFFFINKKVMYDDFQEGTIQKSPKLFNKLITYDKNKIKDSDSLFIRKVASSFTMKLYETKRKLFVINIGTETEQLKILEHVKSDTDLIILSSIKLENIHNDIIVKSICAIQIIHNFLLDSILSLCSSDYIKVWDSILFTTEKYDLSNIYFLDNLIEKNLPFDGLIDNPKQFKFLNDKNGNLAFHKDNKYKPKKMYIPRRKYIPNLPTFRDWESPGYDTPSPTIESPPFTVDTPPKTSNFFDNSTLSPPFVPEQLLDGPVEFTVPKCIRKSNIPIEPIQFLQKRVILKKKKIVKSESSEYNIIPEIVTSNKESPLPQGITLKIKKICPKGSRSFKYKGKIVCKENIDKIT